MWDRRELEPQASESASLRLEWSNADTEALADFKNGIRLLRDRNPEKALTYFRRAADIERNNPYFLSYMGLALGLARQQWKDAERFCEAALRMKRNQSQLYLNLADVYLAQNKKGDAVETLLMGTEFAGRDVRVRRALEKLGKRRAAVIPFLDRKHFLNRGLGKIRHRTHKLLHQQ